MKITLAKSAGFCFGVKRAVDTVYEQLEMSAAERQPIYTFGPIIHNARVKKLTDELNTYAYRVDSINSIVNTKSLRWNLYVLRRTSKDKKSALI